MRKAEPADADRIEVLMRFSMGSLGAGFYDRQEVASAVRFITLVDRRLIDDRTYFVIETNDGEIIGCGGWSKRAKLYTGGRACNDPERMLDPAHEPARIRAMFVHPRWSRRGIGRMILESCEREAADCGFHRLELMATLPGVPLYSACGYKVVEKSDIDLPDGTSIGGALMEKTI